MKLCFLSLIVFFSICQSYSQVSSKPPVSQELAKEKITQHAHSFFIQVAVYSSSKKYFPKLYPIGYIRKETNKQKKVTKYLLGDFANEKEALAALEKVKEQGYKDAFIVNLSD